MSNPKSSSKKEAKFDMSPSSVVQLGESLYKNIYGILIEYITNSYDADAAVVTIAIDRDQKIINISDDGLGMSYEELESGFLRVGKNRRKKPQDTTSKGRLVTGRKGFGKLACFGLFKTLQITTTKNGKTTQLKFSTYQDKDNEFGYTGEIDSQSVDTGKTDGTEVSLIKTNHNKGIPPNKDIAESIAKRVNLMYDNSPNDSKGFVINLEDIKIDKAYRDNIVLKEGVKYKFELPKDLKKFGLKAEYDNFITENNITGIIIARDSTINIKENKGVVLFARGKLCQEATFLNINPSNSFGFSHLYAELDVSFIDGEAGEDNIGTDRTALKETPIVQKLFVVIENLINAYAILYNKKEKEAKDKEIEEFKNNSEAYQSATVTVQNATKNTTLKAYFIKMLTAALNSNSRSDESFKGIEEIAKSSMSYSIPSDQISKDDVKDNLATSYDHLVKRLRSKYNYQGVDGSIFKELYGDTDRAKNMVVFSDLLENQEQSVQTNARVSLRELGFAITSMRNGIYHNNDRACININISVESSKRFIAMTDLFIDMDKLCFKANE